VSQNGKKWTIPSDDQDAVKELIKSYDGVEEDVAKNPHLEWRVKIGKSIFDYFTNGTLYNNQATSDAVLELQGKITNYSTSNLKDTTKEIKIGLDETGKGELFGHEVLCGVAFPSTLDKEIEGILGLANTKSRRTLAYWDEIFAKFDMLQAKGFSFMTHTIPPWDIDRYNVNKIMDVVYKKIISDLCRLLPMEKASLVIDDYQLSDNLKSFLQGMEKKGTLVIIEEKADDKFLEAKAASIIAKHQREKMMKGINERFKIDSISPGTGNLTDTNTQEWIKKWKKSGQEWPWFVKKSVKTIRILDGKFDKAKKINPPIRHELIATDSRKLFDEGKLSSSSLQISCPSCGSELKAVKLTPDASSHLEGRCLKCNKVISDFKSTLFYYNGCIVPDSSAILSGIISKDLQKGRFFENYTILLHPRVTEECDNPGGKAELGRISDIANSGRVKLITLQDVIDYNSKADDEIVLAAQKNNSIILTRDMNQYAKATGLQVFTLV